jgi:hypothetical protein
MLLSFNRPFSAATIIDVSVSRSVGHARPHMFECCAKKWHHMPRREKNGCERLLPREFKKNSEHVEKCAHIF